MDSSMKFLTFEEANRRANRLAMILWEAANASGELMRLVRVMAMPQCTAQQLDDYAENAPEAAQRDVGRKGLEAVKVLMSAILNTGAVPMGGQDA
ncbi:MAG TPA: hypothetical protein VJT33_03925 [bacterium]|nr:hypothetical protein [bacterium]